MTALSIMIDVAQKRLKTAGKVAAGEHIFVTVLGRAEWASATSADLRLRVLCGPALVAKFPLDDGDQWETTEDGGAKCELNLNTIPAAKHLRFGGTCLFVLDDAANHTLYGMGEAEILPWPKERGADEPYNLDGYPDELAALQEAWEAYKTQMSAAWLQFKTGAEVQFNNLSATTNTKIETFQNKTTEDIDNFKRDVNADVATFKSEANARMAQHEADVQTAIVNKADAATVAAALSTKANAAAVNESFESVGEAIGGINTAIQGIDAALVAKASVSDLQTVAADVAALPKNIFAEQTIAPTPTHNELVTFFKTFFISQGGKISAAKEYVRNGLIAMWDAKENAGWATHAAAPSLWKNLVEDKDHWQLTGYASNYYTFGDDYMLISGTNTHGYNAESAGRLYGRSNNAYEAAAVKSIGICLDTSGCVNTARFSAVVFSPAASGSSSYNSRSVFAATDKIWLGSGRFYMAAGGLVSAAANIASANSVEMFLNGERQAVLTDANHQSVYATILGGYSPEAAAGVKIHNLRIYNRALSPGEIELCAGIDAQRFGVNV